MNFETFQATRQPCADLGAATSSEYFLDADGNETTAEGFLYDGDCYIQRLDNGSYYLILHNRQWTDANLENLERQLWQWATDERLFD